MTVKIKDKDLYDVYVYVEAKRDDKSRIYSAYCFLNDVTDSNPTGEVKLIVDAIFDGEKVELAEQKYMVPLPHLFIDGKQRYLIKERGSFDIDCIDYDPLASLALFTLNEIPKEYRQFAKEVDDTDE